MRWLKYNLQYDEVKGEVLWRFFFFFFFFFFVVVFFLKHLYKHYHYVEFLITAEHYPAPSPNTHAHKHPRFPIFLYGGETLGLGVGF